MIWIIGCILAVAAIFALTVLRGAPYVPSHHSEAKAAFDELYNLSSSDVLVDVGSGDGIILRLASRKGSHAVGYELNPILVFISRFLSRGDKNVSVTLTDFWVKDIPDDTTIIYAFVVTRDVEKLERKLQREANRLDRSLYLMTYGAGLKHMKEHKVRRGHRLYRFNPLQEK
ncbi:MAG: hypothetical protein ABJA64_02985 [Candidatus Saccharibacteria bacterium]